MVATQTTRRSRRHIVIRDTSSIDFSLPLTDMNGRPCCPLTAAVFGSKTDGELRGSTKWDDVDREIFRAIAESHSSRADA